MRTCILLVAAAVCFVLLIVGHGCEGAAGAGIMLIGIGGLLGCLYGYNRIHR